MQLAPFMNIKVMREYQIFYRNGDHAIVECESKTDLICQHFNNDETKFKNEVSRLRCSVQTSHYIEDIGSNKATIEVGGADINPYGWRR